MILKKIFLKLTNNAVLGKNHEKCEKKNRATKPATTEKRRNYLVSEPNYHTTKFFTEHLLAAEMKKSQIYIKTCYNIQSTCLIIINLLKPVNLPI